MGQGVENRESGLPAEDFEAIEEAVMESSRGRRFLNEFANRLRARELQAMAERMTSLEAAVTANHEAMMARIAAALAQPAASAAASAPAPELAPRHMKFFKRDEEIFEPAPQAEIAAIKPPAFAEPPRGAKLTIRRAGEPALPEMPEPAEAPPPDAPPVLGPHAAATGQPASEEPPKRRIVIIRHKPGETVDVPLQNELAQAS